MLTYFKAHHDNCHLSQCGKTSEMLRKQCGKTTGVVTLRKYHGNNAERLRRCCGKGAGPPTFYFSLTRNWKATALQPVKEGTAWIASTVSCGILQGSIAVSWARKISSKGTYTYVGKRVDLSLTSADLLMNKWQLVHQQISRHSEKWKGGQRSFRAYLAVPRVPVMKIKVY